MSNAHITAIYPKGWKMPGVGTEAGKSSRRHPHLGTPAWCLPPLTLCWTLEMPDFTILICCFFLLLAVFSVTFALWYIKLPHSFETHSIAMVDNDPD